MQTRITRFKMRADAVEAARALMESLRAEIMDQPGVGRVVITMNPDGAGYVIALIDEAGSSAEAVDRVRGIWHRFHDHLEATVDPEIYEVIADWS
jgi:hypothetical protein